MSLTSYNVTGLTCGHCVAAVTEEVSAIDGVDGVEIDLVAGGTSTLTVRCDEPVSEETIAAALDEAGEYRLAT